MTLNTRLLSIIQPKQPARILRPPNQKDGGKGITRRLLGTDPSTEAAVAMNDLPRENIVTISYQTGGATWQRDCHLSSGRLGGHAAVPYWHET
jgi:hypothetical protein